MVLADVAGLGEGVAHVATGLRRLMHRYINSIKPHRLFTEVNENFTRATSDRLAASVVASYFMPMSTLSICNAGTLTSYYLIWCKGSRKTTPTFIRKTTSRCCCVGFPIAPSRS